jgi:hypothetical protein
MSFLHGTDCESRDVRERPATGNGHLDVVAQCFWKEIEKGTCTL